MASPDLDDLRGAVRGFLQARSPSAAVREVMASPNGYDEQVWRKMAGELGLHGIAVPEEFGGAGAGMPELAVVFEEMGAALLCSPFFATVALAVQAIADQRGPRRDGRATARIRRRFHHRDADPQRASWTVGSGRGRHSIARIAPEGFLVSGDAPMVLDGHTADVVLLAAADTEAGNLCCVAAESPPGLHREPLAGLDRTRKVATAAVRRRTRASSSEPTATRRRGWPRTSDLALVALAPNRSARRNAASTWRWTTPKSRIQFGRPIGSFQAVKHRCADMLVLVEGARSAAVHAAEVADTDALTCR